MGKMLIASKIIFFFLKFYRWTEILGSSTVCARTEQKIEEN
jgi:hypothetical protein